MFWRFNCDGMQWDMKEHEGELGDVSHITVAYIIVLKSSKTFMSWMEVKNVGSAFKEKMIYFSWSEKLMDHENR